MHGVDPDSVALDIFAVREGVPSDDAVLELGVVPYTAIPLSCIWPVVEVRGMGGFVCAPTVPAHFYRSPAAGQAMFPVHVKVIFGEQELAFPRCAVGVSSERDAVFINPV